MLSVLSKFLYEGKLYQCLRDYHQGLICHRCSYMKYLPDLVFIILLWRWFCFSISSGMHTQESSVLRQIYGAIERQPRFQSISTIKTSALWHHAFLHRDGQMFLEKSNVLKSHSILFQYNFNSTYKLITTHLFNSENGLSHDLALPK